VYSGLEFMFLFFEVKDFSSPGRKLPVEWGHLFSKGPSLPHRARMSSRAREIGIVKHNQQRTFSERINQVTDESGRSLIKVKVTL
jgi:hypothetical protein